jgi:hypothetical protein
MTWSCERFFGELGQIMSMLPIDKVCHTPMNIGCLLEKKLNLQEIMKFESVMIEYFFLKIKLSQ